ncbi:uncharacterized protein BP5553_04822 [Venustampulla echinocandica]|uniref:Pentatricopeptide repeat domain-containing protein n=1 Tax=Venustampulla echinocandica TaxID=2656787 RepID=A0A370TPD1_9HELO|nr:uncharacterized protein BP5553_04822 [Venustampulla echinocandica]RDL37389.1 hypothetical protein BP5553_04822 [Venustampulla echinocandica]
MRPALQRLLSRPSSLELLQCLLGNTACITPNRQQPLRCQQTKKPARNYTNLALAPQDLEELCVNYDHGHGRKIPKEPCARNGLQNVKTAAMDLYKPWSERLWSVEQMDFESNLCQASDAPRLLDSDPHRGDMTLWAFLLDYRHRKYGADGVTMFWDTIRTKGIRIPMTGVLADKMWSTFLSLGYENPMVLEQIWKYADNMDDIHGQRWSKLYCRIIQQFLINGHGDAAIRWNDKLALHHSPGPKGFGELCRQVTLWKGDMKALKKIYEKNKHRKVYSKVVPILCAQEDYKAALQWHFFFLQNGDLPATSKLVEPLVHFLAIYDRRNAVRVTKSLVEAGVSFAPSLSTKLNDNTKISREMMNLVHGKFFNISPKTYNDHLGARWFATSWISLDVAINAVHALGVQEIGPLSLQALALRELDTKGVVLRINQLRDLGISLGESLFSRSVETFARARQYEYLEGLLKSDQHPDELEDSRLQESLLASYAAAKDWAQYRRTLEIQSSRSRCPALEKENIILRSHAVTGDMRSVLQTLSQMHQNGTTVKTKSIASILMGILRPRNRGRRPTLGQTKGSDLGSAIMILKQIATSGNYVPVTAWGEILRRLGMLGQLRELENLCVFLASWYGPSNATRTIRQQSRRYRVPTQVPPSHPLHPLKMLFSGAFQKAVIDWGFIHSLKRKPQHSFTVIPSPDIICHDQPPIPNVTFGITLLRRLHDHGVHVELGAVKKAISLRLVTYYGPDRSKKRYNQQAIDSLGLRGGIDRDQSLGRMAAQIDEALGARVFTGADLPELIASRAKVTQRRLRRRNQRQIARGTLGSLPSPTSPMPPVSYRN